MRGQEELYTLFEKLNIQFEYHEHPPLATIETLKPTGKTTIQDDVRTSSFVIIKETDIISLSLNT